MTCVLPSDNGETLNREKHVISMKLIESEEMENLINFVNWLCLCQLPKLHYRHVGRNLYSSSDKSAVKQFLDEQEINHFNCISNQ